MPIMSIRKDLPRGGVCEECVIVGVTPRSEALLNFVGREEGQLLLGFTPNWWNRPDVIRFRYEDLVADAESHLQRLVRQLGEPPSNDRRGH